MKIGRHIVSRRHLVIVVAAALMSAGVRDGGAGLTISLDGEPNDTLVAITFSGSGTLDAAFSTNYTIIGFDFLPAEYVTNVGYNDSLFFLTGSTITFNNTTQGWSSTIQTILFDNDAATTDPGGEIQVPLGNGSNTGALGDSYVFNGSAILNLDPFLNTGFTFADFSLGTYAAVNTGNNVLDEMILEVVPEPNSLMLFGLGLGVLGWFRRRDRSRKT